MNEPAIMTEKLCKSFDECQAVSGLNLRVPQGAVYGFVGRNGAGKTTTMRLLLGLQRATEGRARMLSLDPASEADLLKILDRVAFVPQQKQLYSWATPAELVRINKGFFPKWSDARAADLGKRLDIPMHVKFQKLSIGNRTKVALLLALAQGAEVLVLDEPTAGLDPVTVDELLRTLVDDHVSNGHTIFMSSHHLAELEQICDWIGILEQGKLLLQERLEEVRNHFRQIFVSGENLPSLPIKDVACCTREGRTTRYVVTRNAEAFAGKMKSQGAAILEVSPIGLRELFLYLVRKEDTCTPGNAGAKPEPVSSFS
jgi:ABC-2 type transport system ATP-binding protein